MIESRQGTRIEAQGELKNWFAVEFTSNPDRGKDSFSNYVYAKDPESALRRAKGLKGWGRDRRNYGDPTIHPMSPQEGCVLEEIICELPDVNIHMAKTHGLLGIRDKEKIRIQNEMAKRMMPFVHPSNGETQCFAVEFFDEDKRDIVVAGNAVDALDKAKSARGIEGDISGPHFPDVYQTTEVLSHSALPD